MSDRQLTPDKAHEAILAGHTVKAVVGHDADDPVLLHYLDRCRDDGRMLMIYSEAIGGWSEGVKEAVCAADSSFYVEHVAGCVSITITDQEPMLRESEAPISLAP